MCRVECSGWGYVGVLGLFRFAYVLVIIYFGLQRVFGMLSSHSSILVIIELRTIIAASSCESILRSIIASQAAAAADAMRRALPRRARAPA